MKLSLLIFSIFILAFFLGCTPRENFTGEAGPILNPINYEQGLLAYKENDYSHACDIWMPLAENGNSDAAFKLAGMYDFAEGVPQDYSKSAKWLLRAAECGHGDAQCKLANRYDDGLGLDKNRFKAYYWRWLCVHNKNASRSLKYWADIYLRGEPGRMLRGQIEYIEQHAKQWRPKPHCGN